ncbi:hypothetical protein M1P56_24235 [Streptomyces sp. HU2014]|uniref:Muconolactone isomerase domain-containing protein n=1 Tax=Streptomyces albireticuli TaxID=1940 RepID=A0A1Z2KYP2_9ACTN|nr:MULTISPECIES: hypothetical protein [Streptomyces]ARZ67164.1 hypothetical protein SMD11_1503 [Streptomyces albireticuli]UQI47230.1 hypothetical protein M1P56_24235 [Streptomyces sp. HU2014]
MRTLLRARMDTRAGNEAIKSGSMPGLIQELMDQLKPEAAYFTALDGGRTCLLVFDMEESSQMPAVAEKLFIDMEAEVEMHPVMNYDDLKKGLSGLSRG